MACDPDSSPARCAPRSCVAALSYQKTLQTFNQASSPPAATAKAPAADIAAQTAAGLAMLAKFFKDSPNSSPADKKHLVPRLEARAKRAYEYATAMFERDGIDSTCSRSLAVSNCIGSHCTRGFLAVRSADCHCHHQTPGSGLSVRLQPQCSIVGAACAHLHQQGCPVVLGPFG